MPPPALLTRLALALFTVALLGCGGSGGGANNSVLREGAIPAWRSDEKDWSHVLFVCTGNTDRSPLAAALLSRHLAASLGCGEDELEARGYRISSAGLAAGEGHEASLHVRQVASELFDPPLKLDAHRSRRVVRELLDRATCVLCMEHAHRNQILALFPHREHDVMLLDPQGFDIDDPAGQSLETYRQLARRLDAGTAMLTERAAP